MNKHKLLDWVLKDESRRAWMAQHGIELVVCMWFASGVVVTLLGLCVLGRLP